MSKQKRLIDADALMRRICGAKCGCEYEECGNEGDCDFDHFIFWAPTIDPESLRPVGRWEPVHETKIVNGHLLFADGYECSKCHKGHSGGNYCESCGARMEDGNG